MLEGGGQRAKMNGANSVRSAVRPSAVKLSPFPLFPQKMKSLFLSFSFLSHIEGQLGLDSWKLEGKTSNADRHQLKGVENLLSSSPVRNRQVTYSLTLKQDQDGVANYWKYICYGI